jgi:putative nucleotidyltransferase with HDIG domain
VGIVGEELAFEKEIFFDLSKSVKQMILYLKERNVEKIEFLRGLTKDELSKFISFLVMPKDQVKHEPQEYLTVLGIRNIVVGKIKFTVSSPKNTLAGLSSYLDIYEDAVDKITYSLGEIINTGDIDHLVVRYTLNNVMENLLERYHDLLTLATIKRYDLKTFYHTLNVAMLSMYFASKLGFSRDQVLDIGLAGLFHDIGKLYISRKIIRKPAKLTDQEFDKIKSHVTVGAEIMLKYVESLGLLPVIVCFEHHLRYDLKGYPKVSFYEKPHIVSLIVSICDVYDALSQRRGYKADYPTEMIYNLMIKDKGEAFDPVLLDKFFKIIGVWPVGAIVLLSDARIAVVRKVQEDDIFSPEVEVIVPFDKKENIDLRITKDKVKIERSFNPFREGRQYLSLIYPHLGKGLETINDKPNA